jgi:hypothetical protein
VNRLFCVLVVALLAAAPARADLIPPGTRNIPVEHRIETDAEHPDWLFFVVRGSGGASKVALDPKTPIVIPGSSAVGQGPVPRKGEKERTIPYRASAVVAVPREAAKAYKTEKELLAAVDEGKVAGALALNGHFFDHTNAKANDPRKSIVKRYRLTKLDARAGATLEPVKEGGPEEEEQAAAPGSFRWVAAGLALAAAVGFAGLWLAGRARRPSFKHNGDS